PGGLGDGLDLAGQKGRVDARQQFGPEAKLGGELVRLTVPGQVLPAEPSESVLGGDQRLHRSPLGALSNRGAGGAVAEGPGRARGPEPDVLGDVVVRVQ